MLLDDRTCIGSIRRLTGADQALIRRVVEFENRNLPSVFRSTAELESGQLLLPNRVFHYCMIAADGRLKGSVAFHVAPQWILEEVLAGRMSEAEAVELAGRGVPEAVYFSVFVCRDPVMAAAMLRRACRDIADEWSGRLRWLGTIVTSRDGQRFAEKSGMIRLETTHKGFPCYKIGRSQRNPRYLRRMLESPEGHNGWRIRTGGAGSWSLGARF